LARYNIDVQSTSNTAGLDAVTRAYERQQAAVRGLMSTLARAPGNAVLGGVQKAAGAVGGTVRTAIVGGLHVAQRAAGALTSTLKGTAAVLNGILTFGGLAGAIGFLGATKQAAAFEDQLGIINTIARQTPDVLNNAIGRGLRNTARETGVALNDLSRGFYDLLSAGLGFDTIRDKATGLKKEVLNVEDSLRLMHDAAILGIGGLGSTDQAIDLLTTLINAFNLRVKDSRLIVDVFAKSVELGKVTVSEMGEAMSTVAPLAGAMGVKIQEIAAGIAAMTQQGFTASEATTTMRAFIVGIQRNSKALQNTVSVLPKRFRKSQTAWEDFLRAKGLNATARLIAKASKTMDLPMIKLLGRIEGVQFVLGTTGKNTERWNRALRAMNAAGGTAFGQFTQRIDTAHRRFLRMIESARDFAIAMGTPLLKPLGEFFVTISQILNAMTDWAHENPKAIAAISRLVSVLSAVFALRASAHAMLFLLGPLGSGFLAFGSAARVLTLAIGALALPLAAILTSFTVFESMVKNNVAGFGQFSVMLIHIKNAISTIAPLIGDGLKLIGMLFGGKSLEEVMGTKAGKRWQRAADKLTNNLRLIIDEAAQFLRDELVPGLAQGLKDAWGDFVDNIPSYLDTAGDITVALAGWVTGMLPGLAQVGTDIVDGILDGISTAWDSLFDGGEGPGEQIQRRLGEGPSKLPFLDRLVTATRQNLEETWTVITTWIAEKAAQVGTAMQPLLDAIATSFRDLTTRPRFASGRFEGSSPLELMVKGLVDEVLEFGQQAAERIGEALGDLLDGITTWWGTNGPAITAAMLGLVDGVLEFGQDVADRIGEALQDLLDGIAKWWGENGQAISDSLYELGEQLYTWLLDTGIPRMLDALESLADKLGPALLAGAAAAVVTIIEVGKFIGAQIIIGLLDFFRTLPEKFGEHIGNLRDNALVIAKIVAVGLALGVVLRGAMFLGGLFIGALHALLSMLSLNGIVLAAAGTAGTLIGAAFRAAMFLGHLFIGGISAAISALGTSSVIAGVAGTAGASIGGSIAAGIAGAITLAGLAGGVIAVALAGLAAIGGVANKLLPPNPVDKALPDPGFRLPWNPGGLLDNLNWPIIEDIFGSGGDEKGSLKERIYSVFF
jgi:TP901 family phage tail tape measure protein